MHYTQSYAGNLYLSNLILQGQERETLGRKEEGVELGKEGKRERKKRRAGGVA